MTILYLQLFSSIYHFFFVPSTKATFNSQSNLISLCLYINNYHLLKASKAQYPVISLLHNKRPSTRGQLFCVPFNAIKDIWRVVCGFSKCSSSSYFFSRSTGARTINFSAKINTVSVSCNFSSDRTAARQYRKEPPKNAFSKSNQCHKSLQIFAKHSHNINKSRNTLYNCFPSRTLRTVWRS